MIAPRLSHGLMFLGLTSGRLRSPLEGAGELVHQNARGEDSTPDALRRR